MKVGRPVSVLWLLALTAVLSACVRQPDAPATRRGTKPVPLPTSAMGALKLAVSQTGMHRVNGADLTSAGFDTTALQTRKVALYSGERSVPIWIDPTGSFLCFFGRAPTNRYQSVSTYVLRWGGEGGDFIEELAVRPPDSRSVSTLLVTEQLEENNLYLSRAVTAVDEPWFWQRLAPGVEAEVTFMLPVVNTGEGTFRVALWGATTNREVNPDHRIRVSLNGEPLTTIDWDGEEAIDAAAGIRAGLLSRGENRLTFTAPADTGNVVDITYLDWIEVEYPAPGDLQQETLAFQHSVDDLNLRGSALLFDVTDPQRPVRLILSTGDSERDVLEGRAEGGQRRLFALGVNSGVTPVLVGPLQDSDWSSTAHQADYIVVAPDALTPPLEGLVAARQAQGLSVQVVPLEEIGDEFGFGAITPEAISSLLVTARERWAQPHPRFVLLVGEGTYDYRDYLGLRPEHVVPPALVPIEHGGETVSDTRLADLDADGRPDLAIGRWPVTTPDKVEALIARTLAYQAAGGTSSRALFVTDGTEPRFTRLSDELIQAAGNTSKAVRLYGVSGKEMVNIWSEGAWLVNYTGHGSLELWGKTELMSRGLASQLVTKGRPPIVIQLTCLTGLFAHPVQSSLAEEMLWMDGGPVAIIAATSLTLPVDQQPFGVALLEALMDPSVKTIGEALLQAQRSPTLNHAGGQEIIDTFHLLGDPALVIARPG